MKRHSWYRAAGIFCLVFLARGASTQNGSLLVWALPALERASFTGGVRENAEARLYAARGEYEAFQIVVQSPEAPLDYVLAQPSDLDNGSGAIIPSMNITLYRQHFVQVERASPGRGVNRSLGAGFYPDALLPLDNLMREPSSDGSFLSVGDNFPIWVDVFVPRDAVEGLYSGVVRVVTGQGSREVPIALTVWNFELPLQPSLKSSFLTRTAGNRVDEELVRHKLMPHRVDPRSCEVACRTVRERQEILAPMGLASSGTGAWSGADINNCSMRQPPTPEFFQREAIAHRPDVFLYNYTADEIDACPGLGGTLKAWGRNIRSAGIKNLVVMAPTADLMDDGSANGDSAVDIWVVLPKMFETASEAIRQAIEKGDEVWSYNTLSQDSYSPKWLVDYPLINFRIQPGFINQALGLRGLLYWRTDHWSTGRWDQVNNQGTFSAANYPGEGMLVYPGAIWGVKGVLPSMRLKQLREGVEDFEYIEILRGLGRETWALGIAGSVAQSFSQWTREPEVLESVRLQMGEEINRLMQPELISPPILPPSPIE